MSIHMCNITCMYVCSLRYPCLDRARILHSGDEKFTRTQGRVTSSLPVSGLFGGQIGTVFGLLPSQSSI